MGTLEFFTFNSIFQAGIWFSILRGIHIFPDSPQLIEKISFGVSFWTFGLQFPFYRIFKRRANICWDKNWKWRRRSVETISNRAWNPDYATLKKTFYVNFMFILFFANFMSILCQKPLRILVGEGFPKLQPCSAHAIQKCF